MLRVQAQTFYNDLDAIVKQLSKMEMFLTKTKQVGLLPETLRTQQRQFMVSSLFLFAPFTLLLECITHRNHICCDLVTASRNIHSSLVRIIDSQPATHILLPVESHMSFC